MLICRSLNAGAVESNGEAGLREGGQRAEILGSTFSSRVAAARLDFGSEPDGGMT